MSYFLTGRGEGVRLSKLKRIGKRLKNNPGRNTVRVFPYDTPESPLVLKGDAWITRA